MKKCFYLFLLIHCTGVCPVYSQRKLLSNFFRAYEDNDVMILAKHGTDWGYSNGSRLDLFFERNKRPTGLFSRLSPSVGQNSTSTVGWSVMQTMITPFIVKRDTPNRYDYPYSGSLYVIKTFHAANPGKKINLETQWVAGVMGPPSFCKQVDILFHKTFPKNIRPGGWGFQLPTDLLLNYNFSEEKQIISLKKIASLSEGGQLSLGTMRTGLSLYLLFRSGDSSGAFQGFIEQFFSGKKNKLNVHVSFKPGVDLVVYNALLDGGIFNRLSPLRDKDSPYGSLLKRSLMVGYLQFSALVGFRKYSVSFTQTANSPEYRGFRSHQYANISVNFRW